MEGEYPYYAARSGLTPAQDYSLGDHQSAYWLANITAPGFASLAQDDIEYEFLLEKTGLDSTHTVDDLNLAYWQGLATGLPAGLSVDDYKSAVVQGG